MLINKKKNIKFKLILFLCVITFVFLFWELYKRLEGGKPEIFVDQVSDFIGLSCEFRGKLSDLETGISKYKIFLVKNNKEIILDQNYFSVDFFSGKSITFEYLFKISINPQKLMISDGKAKIKIILWDHSWKNFFKGNITKWEKDIFIDTKAPEIEVLSKQHNLNQGGAGLAIYKVSEEKTINGLYVGNNFFKGYSGYYNDPLVYLCLFALTHDQGPETELYIAAEDQSQNRVKVGLYYHINKKVFKYDNLGISDSFLKKNLPDFYKEISQSSLQTDIEKFVFINQMVRKQNYDKLQLLCMESHNNIYFKGNFLRLPKSATRAGFGDNRSYFYKGKKVDKQVHLGIDLASLVHSPVPAANKGKVVFCEKLGIYGKTVIIDHGIGLFSMYSHLSRVKTEKGKIVLRGEIIGNTGSTGLAGGDHLHFSMIIQGAFTNPIEWWDKLWIRYNITDKMESVSP